MIVIRLNGGLGNQMFQYATARALSLSRNVDLILDLSEFNKYKLRDFELDKYNLEAKINKREYFLRLICLKLKLYKVIKPYWMETNIAYDKTIKNLGRNAYLEGYFQSELYFRNIRNILLKDFVIKEDISEYAKSIKENISEKKISISIHLRRGDYVFDKVTSNIHGVCSLEYYKQAMSLINKKFRKINYFIFSDDITWVKYNLELQNATYVEHCNTPHEDMYLMSLCDHNIIANSSFSWWAAWLNNNHKKIVIAPKNWFKNQKYLQYSTGIACESWIKI